MRKASVLLPNARDFQYEQTKRIKGVKCDGFGSKEVNEFYEKKVTLWVGYNRKSGEKIPYPVQFDTTLYYKESGGLRDHFFIDYSDYKTSDIPEEVFQIFDPKGESKNYILKLISLEQQEPSQYPNITNLFYCRLLRNPTYASKGVKPF